MNYKGVKTKKISLANIFIHRLIWGVLTIPTLLFHVLNFPILLKNIRLMENELNIPELFKGSDWVISNGPRGMTWLLIIGEIYVVYIIIRLLMLVFSKFESSDTIKYTGLVFGVGVTVGSWAYGFNLWLFLLPMLSLLITIFGFIVVPYFIGLGILTGIFVLDFNEAYMITCGLIVIVYLISIKLLKRYKLKG